MTHTTFLELWESDRQKCYEWLARCEGVHSKSQSYVPGCAGSFSIHDEVERERTVWQYKGDWHTTPPDYSLGENVWRMRVKAIEKDDLGYYYRLFETMTAGEKEDSDIREMGLAAAPDTAILWAAAKVME